jgi:hypothetical protein
MKPALFRPLAIIGFVTATIDASVRTIFSLGNFAVFATTVKIIVVVNLGRIYRWAGIF